MSRSRATLLAVLALVVLVAVGGGLWRFVTPQWEGPAPEGPVVVLGGAPDRAARGFELADAGDRELVLSSSRPFVAEIGRSCDEPRVTCVEPDPLDTWGEAQLVARLAAERDWPVVTVVTSAFHVPRSRLLFRRCVGVPVVFEAAEDGRVRVPLRRAVYEAGAAVVSFVAYRDC